MWCVRGADETRLRLCRGCVCAGVVCFCCVCVCCDVLLFLFASMCEKGMTNNDNGLLSVGCLRLEFRMFLLNLHCFDKILKCLIVIKRWIFYDFLYN